MKSLLFFLCVVALASSDLRYDHVRRDIKGAQVLKVVPKNAAEVRYLQGLQLQDKYDFWKEPRSVGASVDIMAPSWLLPILKSTLKKVGIEYTVMIADLEHTTRESIMENNIALRKAAKTSSKMGWTAYYRYDDILDFLDELVATYPDLCSVESAGRSYERRDMKVLKISTGGSGKPAIFIDGGIHAREWISPAVVTYMVNELVTKSAEFSFLDSVDFYVMPSINPDGYEYSHTSDRFWRKTRSETSSNLCMGVDPNRNSDFHWMEGGASSNPCSEIFAGDVPFSEVEMRNVRDTILKYQDDLKVYLTFHSYGQYWMYPWGYTSALPDDWEELDALAQDAVSALTAVHGKKFEIGSSTNVLYVAAGGSDDWAKGVGNVKYSYTVELRDQGQYGFNLPANQIIPAGEETFESLKVVANFVKDTYGKK